jgi:hypothetical protein
MIRLTKGPVPQILKDKAKEWTDALLAARTGGDKSSEAQRSRYRHVQIKTALIEETHGKCAYCESKLRHVTFGDVEHVTPKSRVPERTFDWENLTLACDVCNQRKGSTRTCADSFVDPYAGEPSEHLIFHGPLLCSIPGSTAGLLTEWTLDLNRAALVERRKERIEALQALLHLVVTHPNPQVRDVIRQDIENHEILADREFAGMSREFVRRQFALIDAVTRRAANDGSVNDRSCESGK